MGEMSVKRVLQTFSPYRIIACFAIVYVVKVDGDPRDRPEKEPAVPLHSLIGNDALRGPTEAGGGCNGKCVEILRAVATQRQIDLTQMSIPQVINVETSAAVEEVAKHHEQRTVPIKNSKTNQHSSVRLTGTTSGSLFDSIPVFAPMSNHIQNETCRKHSSLFVHQLKKYSLWALQMYDSSAKLPSGVLKGSVNQFGDYDQCISIDAHQRDSRLGADAESVHIQGKYCLASVDVSATAGPLTTAVDLANAYGFIRSNLSDPGHFIPRFTTMSWALCVPAVCSAGDVEMALVDAMKPYNGTVGLTIVLRVDPDMCHVRQEVSYSFGTVCTLIFYVIVVLFALVATVLDKGNIAQLKYKGRLERTLMAFSLRRGVAELTRDAVEEGDIPCIHGVRAVCTVALYLGHKVLTLCYIPYANRTTLTELSLETWGTLLRTSQVYTDSFLLLSGVLTSYNMSKEMERSGRIAWSRRCVARFIRLTPALLAVLLFYAFLWEHLGEGPLWFTVVKKNADLCKTSLWKNVFYIQNFFAFEDMCATHTYQLALDMQMFVLTPLLVWLLHSRRAYGVAVVAVLLLGSAAARYIVTEWYQLAHVVYHSMTLQQLYRTGNLTYSQALHRVTPYLVGVCLGCVLRATRNKIRIPTVAAWSGWLTAGYFAYLSLLAPSHLGSRNYRYDAHEMALHAVYFPVGWSLALGWVILACATGHGGSLNNLLCRRGLVLCGRISYSVYLTQFAVFFYNVGSLRTSEEFRLLKSVDLNEVFLVILASIAVTLLFDLPMQEIKGIIMDKGRADPADQHTTPAINCKTRTKIQ